MMDYLNKIIRYARIADVSLSILLIFLGYYFNNVYMYASAGILLVGTILNYQRWLLSKVFGKK